MHPIGIRSILHDLLLHGLCTWNYGLAINVLAGGHDSHSPKGIIAEIGKKSGDFGVFVEAHCLVLLFLAPLSPSQGDGELF